MNETSGPSPAEREPMAEARLDLARTLLGRVQDIVVGCDAVGTICFMSDAVAERLGYAPGAVIGRSFAEFVTPDSVTRIAEAMARWSGRRGRPRGGEVDLIASDGTVHAFHFRTQFGEDLFGPGSFVVTLTAADPGSRGVDLVTASIHNVERIGRIAASFLDTAMGNVDRGLDAAVRELSGLEWVTRITVWSTEDDAVVRRAHWDANHGAPTAPPPLRRRAAESALLRHLLAGNEARLDLRDRARSDFAEQRRAFAATGTVSLLAVPLVARGAVLGLIVVESTVTSIIDDVGHLTTVRSAAAVIAAAIMRDRAEAEVAHQARTDRTTGLVNRWAAESDLDATLADLAARRTGGVGVVEVDLNRFKLVNEALGYRSGDRLLAEAAERLGSAAPEGSRLARLSADEFLLVLPDARSQDETVTVAGRMLEVFSVPFEIGGATTLVTARAGVVFVDASAGRPPTAEEVLRRVGGTADEAKRSGRSIETVDPDEEQKRERLRRIGELEHALGSGQLVPYFQGEWDLTTGRVVGAEALVRWRHPDRGVLGATEFVPLAEATGLIGRIGHLMLHEACRAALDWVARVDGFVLRVNVSAQQLRSADFVEAVADALRATGFPASALCLELTESTLLDDPARSRQHFLRLRDLGVALAIDDFGTGYSSILQLKELPLSSLKIDQRFVAGVADSASDRAIVAATLQMARAFGISATAEGVEHERQRLVLDELGCRRVQGFLFSRPEPADRFATRL